MLRFHRRLTFLLLIAFLAGWVPGAPVSAQVAANAGAATDTPQLASQALIEPPLVDQRLPSLVLQIAVAPDPLMVGDTATITITIFNQAPDPADDLVVTLPVPDGAQALPGAATLAPDKGWRWAIGHLEAQSSTTVTGQVRLDRMPAGRALLLIAEATARRLPLPVSTSGGALVADPVDGLREAAFTPGRTARLTAVTGQVEVQFSGRAYSQPLRLRHTPPGIWRAARQVQGKPLRPEAAAFRRGLGIFSLDAVDNRGQAVHQFAQPITIIVYYTPEQLRVRGISEADLTLTWFDESAGVWQPIATTIDRQAHTASAVVDHFSDFELSDLSSPSEAFIPSLQGFQIGLFTGAANYSYPIQVPAGPSGIKPSIELNYNSAATDGPGGQREKQQAGWVGKGWSLDTGSVARNKIVVNNTTGDFFDYFSLVLNGQSFDLVQAEALDGNTGVNDPDPTHWAWHPTNESFIRARVIASGTSGSGIGGYVIVPNGSNPLDVWQPRYTWQIWTKDGTRYDFSEDLWWGWDKCASNNSVEIETYKWLLSQVTDTHGNTITYQYARQQHSGSRVECDFLHGGQATIDQDAWLTEINWGRAGDHRYRAVFNSVARTNDTAFDGADNQYGGTNGQPRETRALIAIEVQSRQSSTWELIREYRLATAADPTRANDYNLFSDIWGCANGQCITPIGPKLTLNQIREFGSNGSYGLPATTFEYLEQAGTNDLAAGGWQRLYKINNGQGGEITLTYEHIAAVTTDPRNNGPTNDLFTNRHRVITRTVDDGTSAGGCSGATTATTCVWQYSYQNPAMNSLGTQMANDSNFVDSLYKEKYRRGPNQLPNSAVLYYNKYFTPLTNYSRELAHPPVREFRGHSYVHELDPAGGQIGHWFYQGDAGCIPTATGSSIYTDTCFLQMREREFWKGREYQTRVSTPGNVRLQETLHTFKLYDQLVKISTSPDVYEAVDYPRTAGLEYRARSGLWRAFSYEWRTETRSYDPNNSAMPPLVKTTETFYNPAYQFDAAGTNPLDPSGIQFGNPTRVDEYIGPITAGAKPIRVTERYYTSRVDATTYIVDREWAMTVRDGLPGEGHLLAMSHNFYDADGTNANNTTVQALGTKGDLTRTTNYLFDLPGPVSAQGQTLSGRDTVYTYDAYGNSLTVTTYAGPSTRLFNGSAWNIGPAGGASPAPRTTTTEYESTFYVFPTKVTHPAVNSVALVEQADYDYRMGTLIKVVGPHGNIAAIDCRATSFSIPATEMTTCARYDVLGRMRVLVKPGDSTSAPSAQTVYDDAAIPFRFLVETFTGSGDKRRIQKFYDGIGQLIQVKSESVDDLQNIVEDTVYNGLGQVVKQSQARYVTENQPATVPTSSYWLYTPWDSDVNMRWTTMTYDTLGRPLISIAPDGTTTGIRTEHHYGVVTGTITLSGTSGVITKTSQLSYDDLINPNRHRIQTRTDAFGRLVESNELDGDCANYWGYTCTGATTETWAPYTKTRYGYSGADQLTDVFDAQNNHSQMVYDSLGRKTSMIDPDMGAWSYQYDIGGNLVQQTDAKSQVLWFGYDARNRLIEKRQNNSSGTLLASYSYDETTLLADGQTRYGLGQRTSMTAGGATTRWRYDARGRKVREEYTVTGLTGTRAFQWSYDSADRIATLTYPSAEVLTYSYDAAWRPIGVCSSVSGNPCYSGGAQYNALNQPTQWTLGNALVQRWQYSSPAQRLDTLQVGTSSAPGSVLERHYTYDSGGNILTIQDALTSQTQYFSYDHLERLRFAGTSPVPSGTAFALPMIQQRANYGRGPGMSAPLAMLTDATGASLPVTTSPLDWRHFDADPTIEQIVSGAGGHEEREAIRSGLVPPRATEPLAPLASPVQRRSFGRLPLAFVPNAGQTDAQVRYQARGMGGTLFFTPDELVLALPLPTYPATEDESAAAAPRMEQQTAIKATRAIPLSVLRLRFDGARPHPAITALDRLPGIVNELIGADPARWRTSLPTYAGVVYQQLYNGIDLRYDGTDGHLKSTYLLAPGADPSRIRWHYQGARDVQLDPDGNLVVTPPIPTIAPGRAVTPTVLIEQAPLAWQEIDGRRVPVAVRYQLLSNRRIGFTLGAYDVTQPLTIDPSLSYSSYLGDSGDDMGYAIAVDSAGNSYIAGRTASSTFPLAQALQSSYAGTIDAFVAKLAPDGQSLVYSTYLGGSSTDYAQSIAVNSAGQVALTGRTLSPDFPTLNPFQAALGSSGSYDAFVTRLSADGAMLLSSSYLGGSGADVGYGIALDAGGNIYLTGETSSTNFPTAGALQPTKSGGQDAFVAKLNAAGTTLLSSSYLGGSGTDSGRAIAVDSTGSAYLTGETASIDFPTTNALQPSPGGISDAFVVKLAGNGQTLTYSTYLGGGGVDSGRTIAVDGSGNVYVAGQTLSANFPTANPLQATLASSGAYDAFIAQLSSSGSTLSYSTYLGGSSNDYGESLALDATGTAYVTGRTQSTNFPTANPLQASSGGGTDVFVTALRPNSGLLYSTYLGGSGSDQGWGIALDQAGNAYLTGQTSSSNFPTATSQQGTLGGEAMTPS